MFTRISVKNFKSLIDLDVDLSQKKKEPKSLVVIYGENGVGKSNFASIFYTLRESMETMSIKFILQRLMNSNLDEANHLQDKIFRQIIQREVKDTESIITSYKTVKSTEPMELHFEFVVDSKIGSYTIAYNDQKITEEKLEFQLVKNKVTLYHLKNHKYSLNEKIFKDPEYAKDFSETLEQYVGKHSFLSLLSYEVEEKAEEYVMNRVHPLLISILYSLKQVSMKIKPQSRSEKSMLGWHKSLLPNMKSGTIFVKDQEMLKRTERMLNEFFTTTYSDIKKVYYIQKKEKTNIKYELWLKKKMYGKIVDINFTQESSGTQQLLEIIPYLLLSVEGRTVIIDELDTGIHDILIYQILNKLTPLIKGQLILTTHNTMLIDSEISPESIYVFYVDHEANKALVPITKFEGRTHPNLNYQNRYLRGMYGGIPFSRDVDFEELVELLEEEH